MKNVVLIVVFGVLGLSTAQAQYKPLEVVDHVDLERYLGTWYEIAAIPQRSQKGCVGVTATYSLLPDGKIRVINSCREETLDGKLRDIEGKAWVLDKKTNAKLEVQFGGRFSGDYWIIALDADYQWAVVGHPSRNFLWILCRKPHMEQALYADLIDRIGNKGYDIARIKPTLQPAD